MSLCSRIDTAACALRSVQCFDRSLEDQRGSHYCQDGQEVRFSTSDRGLCFPCTNDLNWHRSSSSRAACSIPPAYIDQDGSFACQSFRLGFPPLPESVTLASHRGLWNSRRQRGSLPHGVRPGLRRVPHGVRLMAVLAVDRPRAPSPTLPPWPGPHAPVTATTSSSAKAAPTSWWCASGLTSGSSGPARIGRLAGCGVVSAGLRVEIPRVVECFHGLRGGGHLGWSGRLLSFVHGP
jgi:hypothetical protein